MVQRGHPIPDGSSATRSQASTALTGSVAEIKNFCLDSAALVFCTVSGSAKLRGQRMDLLLIDEAAQLKECESLIPLQLHGLKHAVLIGDECQLPATVKSKVHFSSLVL